MRKHMSNMMPILTHTCANVGQLSRERRGQQVEHGNGLHHRDERHRHARREGKRHPVLCEVIAREESLEQRHDVWLGLSDEGALYSLYNREIVR